MPNHIHGIIFIKNLQNIPPEKKKYEFEISEQNNCRSLQGIIRDFKSVTTRIYKKMFNGQSSLWQASFYDEVIRNEQHYDKVWEYIENNPRQWEQDELYN